MRNVCRRVFSFLFSLSTFLLILPTASARPQLHRLDIRVVLSRNGDARITETRLMTIDSEGTECYIGMGTPDGSEIRDLTVSDETGYVFENVGAWDVDRSRSWKTGKCGIVNKHGGCELCWGLGDSGERTYITTLPIPTSYMPIATTTPSVMSSSTKACRPSPTRPVSSS